MDTNLNEQEREDIKYLPKGRYLVIDSCYLDHDIIDYQGSIKALIDKPVGIGLADYQLKTHDGRIIDCFLGGNGTGDVERVDLRYKLDGKELHYKTIEAPCDAGHHVFISLERYPEAVGWPEIDSDYYKIIEIEEDLDSPKLVDSTDWSDYDF